MIASSDDSTIDASRRAVSSWPALSRSDAPLRGDVAEDQHAAGDLARARRGSAPRCRRSDARAVPANEHGVVRQADDDALAQRPRRRALDRLRGSSR